MQYNYNYKIVNQMSRSTTSPFRGVGGRRDQPQSLELLIKSLQRENNTLVQQINVLKSKNRMVTQLQDKINLVLKHNTQLLTQNEKLAKLINQKKSEVEVWKNKYQSLSLNRSAATELENRKLINQIEKLKQQITDIQHIKNVQITQIKNQSHLDIQNIKRINLSNNQKYQLEIRKLKELLDKKDYQLSQFSMRLTRSTKETDFQIAKLKEEKQRLRSDLLFQENQHKKQIDALKTKFDYTIHSEIDALKKKHLNQMESLDYENSKLKDVIASKNNEIEQILAKNLKVKNNYEDSIDLIKRQNQDLKEKIIEAEHVAKLQLNNLRDKLQNTKDSELSLLKASHNDQMDLLSREISKLQQIIDSRNHQLELVAKERNQMRLSLEAEILKARAALQAQINENRDMIARHQDAIKICDHDLKCKNQEMKTIESYLANQIAILKDQRDSTSSMLDKKCQELDRCRKEAQAIKKQLQSELQNQKQKSINLYDDLKRQTQKSNEDLAYAKKVAELKTQQLNTKIQALEEENQQKDNIIQEKDNILQSKGQQIKACEDKIVLLENCQKDLRKELRDNASRWADKEDEYNSLVKNQIQASEKTRQKQVDELISSHENKVKSLKHQIKQLEKQVEDKNNGLRKLKEEYELLVNRFEEVFGQQAAQKSLDIKIPGWLPDTLAIKSLFDVFLKNKVLEYCS